MSKHTFELDADQADSIVVQSLQTLLECLQSDLNRVKEAERGMIFDLDREKDIKEIKKHIKSFKCVLRYYEGDV